MHLWVVAGLEKLVELRRVLRLREEDVVVVRVLEVEQGEVEVIAERRLDVALPVEAVLPQVLAEALDQLPPAREAVEQLVGFPPLAGSRVGDAGDEDRRARGCERSSG